MPNQSSWRVAGALFISVLLILLTGCANPPNNPDPYEPMNRFFFDVNEGLDKVLLKPATDVYVKIVPRPIRTGVGNFLDNLGYGNVILNDLLQGKFDQGLQSTVRMAGNSTFGLFGVLDVASKWGLPAHSNDFGITWGKWNAGPGPYLVLPLYGPSSVRDLAGRPVSMVTNPLFWVDISSAITIPLDVMNTAEKRANVQGAIDFRNQAAIDSYVFTREAYLQLRAALVKEEKAGPGDDFYQDDMYDEGEGTIKPPSTTQPKRN
jgi:phospholipid-binding lipoprotein MlaA